MSIVPSWVIQAAQIGGILRSHRNLGRFIFLTLFFVSSLASALVCNVLHTATLAERHPELVSLSEELLAFDTSSLMGPPKGLVSAEVTAQLSQKLKDRLLEYQELMLEAKVHGVKKESHIYDYLRVRFHRISKADHTYLQMQEDFNRLRSLGAELKTALTAEGTIDMGASVASLPWTQQLRRALRDSGSHLSLEDLVQAAGFSPKLLGREIDVVIKKGKAWVEVKNNKQPMDRLRADNRDQILQLLRLQKLINRGIVVNGVLIKGDVQEIHYFVMGGMSRRVANMVEKMGLIVHGDIVD